MPSSHLSTSVLNWAKISILKLVVIALWCLALIVAGGFPPPQGVILGLVTGWLLADQLTPDLLDLGRPLSQRSVSFVHSATILVLKLVVIAFWCLIFIVGGGFSARQGIMLGVVVSFLLADIVKKVEIPVWRFYPYHVHVRPNWYKLLSDFKLIGTLEEWHSLQRSSMHFSSPEHRVLREGTSFTALEQSKDHAHAALIFQNGYHPSGFQFKADMNPIQIEQKHSFNLSYAHNQRPAR